MEVKTIECLALSTTEVPKAIIIFKKISFDAASSYLSYFVLIVNLNALLWFNNEVIFHKKAF